jgi:hypothetical protein
VNVSSATEMPSYRNSTVRQLLDPVRIRLPDEDGLLGFGVVAELALAGAFGIFD